MPPIVGLTLNYRDAVRTSRCVSSLLAGGVTAVLIWDNSADGRVTASVLRDEWREDSRVHIEISAANLGFAAAVNRGIECVRVRHPGAWVFLINNDAVIGPNVLERLERELATNPKAILVCPNIRHGCQIRGISWYHRWSGLVTSNRFFGSFPSPSGCAILFAPERWSLPLFDEAFFMYGEDVFLGWQHRNTCRLIFLNDVSVWHEGSASSGMASEFYETRLVAAHLQLAAKLASNRLDHLWLLFGRCISLPARAMLRSVRYRSWVPLSSLWRGMRESQMKH